MPKAQMRDRNRHMWMAVQNALPKAQVTSGTWQGVDDILAILTPFAECEINHALLPTGGGMDLETVRRSREEYCIELVVSERVSYIVRPDRLILERFPQAPIESFLLLELAPLRPTGIYGEVGEQEELVDLGDRYVDRYHWDEGTLGEDDRGRPIPLPRDARLVSRFMSGKVMVVSKGSIWNGVPETYDGRHSRLVAAEIRSQITGVLERLGVGYENRFRDA